MKRLLIILGIIVLLLSLSFNAYSFGYKWAYQKGFNQGVQAVSNAVSEQFKAQGKVSAVIDGQTVVLVSERPVAKARPRIEDDPIIP